MCNIEVTGIDTYPKVGEDDGCVGLVAIARVTGIDSYPKVE